MLGCKDFTARRLNPLDMFAKFLGRVGNIEICPARNSFGHKIGVNRRV
jgi:hypothetical protein